MRRYFDAFSLLWRGLRLTLWHFLRSRRSRVLVGLSSWRVLPMSGLVTLRYPKEHLPIPDHGRNQLHNEIEDCIVCDKCARICPVDCISIESIRSPELISHTSDGTPKRLHAARFDIDMAKCCFCGLCTSVCPTECLTMQPVYAYSSEDVETHLLSFSTLSEEEITAHRATWSNYLAEEQKQSPNQPAKK